MNSMKSCFDYVREFKSKYPETLAWRIKKHSAVMDKHINPDEKILYAFAGQKNDRAIDIFNTYVVVLTDKRILLATKRVLFGYFFKSITPDMYNDLTIHEGIIWGRVEIDTIKEVIYITNISKSALTEIETNISEAIIIQKNNTGLIRSSEKSTK